MKKTIGVMLSVLALFTSSAFAYSEADGWTLKKSVEFGVGVETGVLTLGGSSPSLNRVVLSVLASQAQTNQRGAIYYGAEITQSGTSQVTQGAQTTDYQLMTFAADLEYPATPEFYLTGKAGFADVTASGVNANSPAAQRGLLIGVGLAVKVTPNLTVRGGVENISGLANNESAKVMTLGARVQF